MSFMLTVVNLEITENSKKKKFKKKTTPITHHLKANTVHIMF